LPLRRNGARLRKGFQEIWEKSSRSIASEVSPDPSGSLRSVLQRKSNYSGFGFGYGIYYSKYTLTVWYGNWFWSMLETCLVFSEKPFNPKRPAAFPLLMAISR